MLHGQREQRDGNLRNFIRRREENFKTLGGEFFVERDILIVAR